MTTKSAILPRLLPGFPTLPPMATSAGYTMPHERFFIYGIGFSALVHAAVLFGFPARTPITPPVAPPPIITCGLGDYVPVNEPEPPKVEENEPEAKKVDDTTADAGAALATLGENFRPSSDLAFDVKVDRFAVFVPPNPDGGVWKVPSTVPTGRLHRGDGGIIPLADLDKKPVATSCVAPRYPSEARRSGLAGSVVLRFVVDNHGEVSDVEILSAATPEFGRAASEAMLRWKFNPGMKNGRRVTTRMEMPMVFSLANAT